MAAQAKRVVVNGTTYQVRCSYGQQRDYERQYIALVAAVEAQEEDVDERLRAAMEHAVEECVEAVEDGEGVATEITEENYLTDIDGGDLQRLFLHIAGQHPHGVDVVGAVPFQSSLTPVSDS